MNLEQFRDHLAESMGIKGRGNTLAADDANYLEEVIQNCQEELEEVGVATWSLDDIPRYARENLTLYCEASIRRFGLQMNPVAKKFALDALRYITVDKRAGVGTAEYY